MKDESKSKKQLIEELRTLRKKISRLESEFHEHSQTPEYKQQGALELVQRYLDVVHVMIVELDTSGNVVQINKRGCEILGYDENYILGKNWFDNFLPEYFGPEVKRVFQELMSGSLEAQEFFENPVVTNNGEERLIAWHNLILKNSDGNISGTLSSGLDITQDFYTSEKLKQTEEKFKMLFEKMITGFALHEIICDNKGRPVDYRFLEINPSFETMTGLSRDRVIGRTVKDVLPGIESYWIETYGKVALTGESVQFENYSKDLDRHFEVVAFSPEKGQFATIFIDISGRRDSE